MPESINKVFLLGNLGSDPEFRQTNMAKFPVCNFRLATNEWIGHGPNRRESVQWHRIVAWGRLAEICAEHLRKGSRVHIEGRLRSRKYEDSRGRQCMTTEVEAKKIIFEDRPPYTRGDSKC